MTLEEAIKAAENGDLSAAFSLGRYYLDQDEHDDAIKWYEVVANADIPNAMTILVPLYMAQGHLRSSKVMRSFYGIEDALSSFLNAYKWSKKLVSIYETATPPVEQHVREKAINNMQEAAYFAALYSYICGKNDDALRIIPNTHDDRTDILRGVLLIEKDADAYIHESLTLLSKIENNRTYGASEKSEVEDDVYVQAALYLSMSYRKGLGASINLEKALNVLKFVRNYAKDEEYIEHLDQEIRRYQPKLFGGYKYVG